MDDIKDTQVLSMGSWLTNMIILIIPFVGIIMLFVWAFGNNDNLDKQNWAKAGLALTAISVVLSILISLS